MAYRPFRGDAEAATRYLSWMVRQFGDGRTHPLAFGTRASWALVTSKLGRKGPRLGELEDITDVPEAAWEKISTTTAQHWWGGDRLAGDADHPAVARVFERQCPLIDDEGRVTSAFAALAHGIWHPLLAAEESA